MNVHFLEDLFSCKQQHFLHVKVFLASVRHVDTWYDLVLWEVSSSVGIWFSLTGMYLTPWFFDLCNIGVRVSEMDLHFRRFTPLHGIALGWLTYNQVYPEWLSLPLAPYARRRTLLKEIVPNEVGNSTIFVQLRCGKVQCVHGNVRSLPQQERLLLKKKKMWSQSMRLKRVFLDKTFCENFGRNSPDFLLVWMLYNHDQLCMIPLPGCQWKVKVKAKIMHPCWPKDVMSSWWSRLHPGRGISPILKCIYIYIYDI